MPQGEHMESGAGAAKAKKAKRETVSPTAETNRRIMKECAVTRVKIDVKKVMEVFNCDRQNAIILAAAAEHNLVPGGGQK